MWSRPRRRARRCVVGLYVGCATVGVFATWYTRDAFLGIDLSGDGHSTVSFAQLRDWEQCASWKGFQVRAAGRRGGAPTCAWRGSTTWLYLSNYPGLPRRIAHMQLPPYQVAHAVVCARVAGIPLHRRW